MSMISSSLLFKIDETCREFSNLGDKTKPFANKTVILFGDPLQLPSMGRPLFCSSKFKMFRIYNLKTIVRQQGDMAFAEILQSIRMGVVTKEAEEALRGRVIDRLDYKDLVEKRTTIVFSTRRACDEMNQQILDNIEGEEHVFTAIDTSMGNTQLSEVQKLRLEGKPEKFRTVIRLKVNATVVLRRNLDVAAGQVNGRRAIVEQICKDHTNAYNNYVMLQSLDGKERWAVKPIRQTIEDYGQDPYQRWQLPIDLGFASTVHRVQGMTLDDIVISLDETFFDSGQAYVALTRTKRLDQIRLLKFDKRAIFLDDYYRSLVTWMSHMDVHNTEGDKQYPFPRWT